MPHSAPLGLSSYEDHKDHRKMGTITKNPSKSFSQYKVMKSCAGTVALGVAHQEVRAGAGTRQGASVNGTSHHSLAVCPEVGPISSQGFRVSSKTGSLGEVNT